MFHLDGYRFQTAGLSDQCDRNIPRAHAFQQQHARERHLNVWPGGYCAVVWQDDRRIFCDGIGKWTHPIFAGCRASVIFFHNPNIAGNNAAFLVVNFRHFAERSPSHRGRRMSMRQSYDLRIQTMYHRMQCNGVIHVRVDGRIVLQNFSVEVKDADVRRTKRTKGWTEAVHQHLVLADGYAQMTRDSRTQAGTIKRPRRAADIELNGIN
jgi:hypothetical protein